MVNMEASYFDADFFRRTDPRLFDDPSDATPEGTPPNLKQKITLWNQIIALT